MEDALEVVKGWDPVMSAVIETTPPGLLIDVRLSLAVSDTSLRLV